MQHSLLIMMFGQSNADAHNSGPAIVSPALDDPRVVVPNDGQGFRGWRGVERTKPITGFESAYNPEGKFQSISAAIGATYAARNTDPTVGRVIVRSAAKGNRALHGVMKDGHPYEGLHLKVDGSLSNVFEGFVEDVRQMAAAARADGLPIRHIYIPFFHGEADRSKQRGDYAEGLTNLMDDIDGQMCRLGLPTTWMLTQPSGTGPRNAGNGWENRLAAIDIGQSRSNAFLASTNYAYPLGDGIHLTPKSKALIGEALGHRMHDHQSGHTHRPALVDHMSVEGTIVDLHFASDNGLILDDSRFPAPLTPMGFDISGQLQQSIVRVEQTSARGIRLHCARTLDGARTRVDYAYVNLPVHKRPVTDSSYPLGRGCLREDYQVPSQIFPGEDLLRWVPGFSMRLDEATVRRQAA